MTQQLMNTMILDISVLIRHTAISNIYLTHVKHNTRIIDAYIIN